MCIRDSNYTGGGLLGDVNNLSKQQLGQGGLNPMQSAGLEMQRQTLIDPRYSQGYEQMRSMGSGLMGAGVAGNPFTSGQGLYKNMGAPVTQPAYSQAQPYQQNQATLAASMPINSMPAAPAVAQAPVMDQSALQEFMRQWQAQQDAKNQQNTNDSGGSA